MKLTLSERKEEANRIIEEMNVMAQEKNIVNLFRDERFEECQARRESEKGLESYVRLKLFSLDSKEVKELV